MAGQSDRDRPGFDVLRVPLLGPFLRWRHARVALQWPLALVAALVIYDGLFGPQLAPKNLAGVLPWIQWRGLTVLALLLAGSLFCLACPFMLPRHLAKRVLPATRIWPRWPRGKLPAALLLGLYFWFYEAFAPWASPWLTAWLILAYFGAAFLVDGFFKGAAFCKHLCPIGQFNFVNSLVSPVEIKTRRQAVCKACTTKNCIMGPLGCETWLFQEQKAGNMDCSFCLSCIHACPHDNVGILARLPASELVRDPRRSGVGRFGERPDLACLALVVVFGAFLNAFGMVGPFDAFERWVAALLSGPPEPVVLLLVFAAGLLVLPATAVGAAAWAGRALAGSHQPLLALATRYSFALVPLGFGMWAAHNLFHFMTGGLTIVPALQAFLADLGLPLLGSPGWSLGPLVPSSWLLPVELICLEAGLLASLVVAHRIAAQIRGNGVAWLPWALLAMALFAAGVWLMLQPMQMRGMMKMG